MADNDFFRMDQEQWYCEFVDFELSQILGDTVPQIDFSEFDDAPF
jgi:hypothetical protein